MRCRHHDLGAEEVKEHARCGKQVTQLGLIFDGRIGFVLDAKAKLRKLRFLDVIADKLDAQDGSDPDQILDGIYPDEPGLGHCMRVSTKSSRFVPTELHQCTLLIRLDKRGARTLPDLPERVSGWPLQVEQLAPWQSAELRWKPTMPSGWARAGVAASAALAFFEN